MIIQMSMQNIRQKMYVVLLQTYYSSSIIDDIGDLISTADVLYKN